TIVVIPLVKWQNGKAEKRQEAQLAKERETQRELAEARGKNRDMQMESVKAEVKADIESVKSKMEIEVSGIRKDLEEHDKKLASGNIRFNRIDGELKDMNGELKTISIDSAVSRSNTELIIKHLTGNGMSFHANGQ
ncbi:MAG: hypothetical protein FWC26_00910, partial [Fibromonadales bacterium]|nr:hypothetical protein [Fibromonadales bacterium]